MSDLCKLITFTDMGIRVRVANSKGYEIAEIGDGINIGAAGSHTQRGRVQKRTSGTLTTVDEMAVVTYE